jgi:acid phosphatase (class A)
VASVPPPPAPGSPADQADLQTEIDVQNSRTPERSAQAKQDASLSMSLYLKEVNPTLNAKNDPKLYFLFQQIQREEGAVNGPSKGRFKRPRPFVAHADVIHPLGTIGGFSYPSGHATDAFCHAVILGSIFPDKATLFLDDATRIAQSRVVMGVHYTTDIEEGERDGRENLNFSHA